ncbi:MAG: hypothetical protein ACLPN6_28615 [Streptosporangiaceae bacterium]|jgi:hypothetical protein
MSQHRARLLHRIAVDWAADTFGLRTPDARVRHEDARFRASVRAAALHERAQTRARANAALPARLHAGRGEPRVLTGWQDRIGRLAGRGARQASGQSAGQGTGQRGGQHMGQGGGTAAGQRGGQGAGPGGARS